jgi:MFS family permease
MGGVRRPAGQQPDAAKAGTWRLAPSLPTAAAGTGFVALALAVVYFWLGALAHQTPRHILVAGTLIVAFGGVGLIVAYRQPRNRLGWLLLGLLFLLELFGTSGSYAVLDYRLGHHGLPLGPVAVVLANTAWLPALALVPLIILLFPDGYLPTPRWRWAVWAYAGLVACLAVVAGANAIAPVVGHDIRIDASGSLTSSGQLPGWLANPPVWFDVFVVAGLVGIVLSAVGRQVLSWRGATGERRQQLKWLAFGAAVAVVWLIAMLFSSSLPIVGIAALPVSVGVAILRYRLYDIDRIISRTLAYAIVTGLLVGLYAGLVLLATQVFKFHSTVAVAASTLAAAALFNPLRLRVQRSVDRRFNRARYDADQTVAAFAARLKDAVDLDSVRDDLAAVVHKALEPAQVSVWIGPDERH